MVGRYQVLRVLGQGGMATVYLARQTGIERPVALKELAVLLAGDENWARRFLREARLAGSLSHPSIVTVHEYFEHDGVPYLSMEYLERGSLRGFMGELSLGKVAGVLEGVLAGLAHAESHGIVHRDLKPENLMVTSEGGIKIADFGISRAYGKSAPAEFKTQTGVIAGTPAYMAPEQAMAKELGPWTDLYSLGVIAYELLVDRVPFHAESDVVLLLKHVNEPPPPLLSVKPDLDPSIVAWVERLLEKDEARRPQTAAEAWGELEEIVPSILGPMWRRHARLLSPRGDEGAKPLTPAVFEKRTTGSQPSAIADASPDTPAAETALEQPEKRPGAAVGRILGKRTLALAAVVLALAVAGVVAGLLALGGGGGAGPVSLAWRFQTGGMESSSPLVTGNRVVLGSQNRNVHAVDAALGRQIWETETGRIVFSTPAAASGLVYIGSEDRNVYALRLGTGREVWRFQTGGQVHSSPAVAKRTVYVGSDDGKVYAIDSATGKKRWQFETARPIESSPAVAGTTVYVGGRDTYFYAIDAATGKERWRFKTGSEIWSSPGVGGGTVFVGSP